MATELEQADADAMLLVEAFAFGLWDEYMAARKTDVSNRIAARFRGSSSGSPTGPIPGVGTPTNPSGADDAGNFS